MVDPDDHATQAQVEGHGDDEDAEIFEDDEEDDDDDEPEADEMDEVNKSDGTGGKDFSEKFGITSSNIISGKRIRSQPEIYGAEGKRRRKISEIICKFPFALYTMIWPLGSLS